MTRLFKKLGANEIGRDFVLGDIHGAYDLVIQGMREVRFNGHKDRLLVVGDLIDRGPGSHRVLEFLQQPLRRQRTSTSTKKMRRFSGSSRCTTSCAASKPRLSQRCPKTSSTACSSIAHGAESNP